MVAEQDKVLLIALFFYIACFKSAVVKSICFMSDWQKKECDINAAVFFCNRQDGN
jgi:hypothetical protein